ncbi:unnamed protein product [Protopolystoma xenopodis]|uniref:Uncharacterized protein n=1 Tax=Protopolystoma xenopodis TaxID=117903 RepID=A0A448XGN5_9PLAT|nr:unnamed protein product [Protopolystoma xenopodis]
MPKTPFTVLLAVLVASEDGPPSFRHFAMTVDPADRAVVPSRRAVSQVDVCRLVLEKDARGKGVLAQPADLLICCEFEPNASDSFERLRFTGHL